MEYRLVTEFIRPPMTSNDQKRAHYYAVAKAKKLVGTAVRKLAEAQGIRDLGPSTIEVVWFVPTKRAADNDALGPFLKAAKDGLVDAGVWTDDNYRFVVKDSMSITDTDTKNPRIEIYIKEVESDCNGTEVQQGQLQTAS